MLASMNGRHRGVLGGTWAGNSQVSLTIKQGVPSSFQTDENLTSFPASTTATLGSEFEDL